MFFNSIFVEISYQFSILYHSLLLSTYYSFKHEYEIFFVKILLYVFQLIFATYCGALQIVGSPIPFFG